MSIATDSDLRARLAGVAEIGPTASPSTTRPRCREPLMDDLVFEAVFNEDAGLRDAARWVIWSASQALGCGSASITAVPGGARRGAGDRLHGPGHQRRAAAYLTARQAFAAAIERDAGTVIFEIAKSEMACTDQRPAEYTAAILAAALREGWRTRCSSRATTSSSTPRSGRRSGRRDGQAEGPHARGDRRRFLNIDIDSSTLVDLATDGRRSAARERREHGRADAPRPLLQPDGVTISIGGEIGEVEENSTEEELRATSTATWRCSATASSRSARSASRPGRATAASCCRTAAWPR